MLKKESKEVTRQSLVFLVVIAVMSVIITLSTGAFGTAVKFGDMFFPVFQLGLLVFTVFMGISLFSADNRSGGLEYLFTLPYSRLQILKFKALPRLLAALGCFAIYAALLYMTGSAGTKGPDVLSTGPFLLIFLSLFIIGLSMSAFFENIVMSTTVTFLTFVLFFGAVHLIYPAAVYTKLGGEATRYLFYGLPSIFAVHWHQSVPYLYFAIFALLGGFLAAFIYAFKQFSLKSPKRFTKRYIKVLIPVVIAALGISLVWATASVRSWRNYYYLTENDSLIEWTESTARVYSSKGSAAPKTLETDDYFFLAGDLEQSGKLYSKSFGTRYRSDRLVEFDTKTWEEKVVYEPKSAARMGYYFWGYKDQVAFMELSKGKNRERIHHLVLLNPATGNFKKILIPEKRRTRATFISIRVFGAGETAGKRFWLVTRKYGRKGDMRLVWESGDVEDLGFSSFRPVFVNNMLIYGEDKFVTISKLNDDGSFEKVKQIPGLSNFKFPPPFYSKYPGVKIKELYGGIVKNEVTREWQKIYRLDMETLEITEVNTTGPLNGWLYYYQSGQTGSWYFFGCKKNMAERINYLEELFRLEGGAMVSVKKFEPFATWSDTTYFNIYKNGFVTKAKGKVTVYKFPDLNTVTYKGLN